MAIPPKKQPPHTYRLMANCVQDINALACLRYNRGDFEPDKSRETVLELLLIWRMIRRWWWIGIIPVIITTVTALPSLLSRSSGGGGFSQTISYSAAQSLEAIARTDGDYQDLWLASELAVNAFTEWMRGSKFKDEVVAAAAGDGVTIEPSLIGIVPDNARSVGRIDLGYPTAEGMEAVGNAVIQVLSTRSQDYFAQLGGVPAAVTILNKTPVTPAPPPLIDRFTPLVRIGLGAAAGVLLMAMAFYLDPFLRTRSDLDSSGLRVLGSIPKK